MLFLGPRIVSICEHAPLSPEANNQVLRGGNGGTDFPGYRSLLSFTHDPVPER